MEEEFHNRKVVIVGRVELILKYLAISFQIQMMKSMIFIMTLVMVLINLAITIIAQSKI
jgi:hypothetical protein